MLYFYNTLTTFYIYKILIEDKTDKTCTEQKKLIDQSFNDCGNSPRTKSRTKSMKFDDKNANSEFFTLNDDFLFENEESNHFYDEGCKVPNVIFIFFVSLTNN